MHILVDMDDVIVEWGRAKDEGLRYWYPRLRNFRFGELQTTWDMMEGLDKAHVEALEELMDRPRFYWYMDPVYGAAEALEEMVAAGHEVSIVSTPWPTNPTCLQDKSDWLDAYIGEGWSQRLILTRDKTAIRGDILFDDKPEIKGKYIPEWQQIVIDRPHNWYRDDCVRIDSIVEWREGLNMLETSDNLASYMGIH